MNNLLNRGLGILTKGYMPKLKELSLCIFFNIQFIMGIMLLDFLNLIDLALKFRLSMHVFIFLARDEIY